jgi:hypothetical protein
LFTSHATYQQHQLSRQQQQQQQQQLKPAASEVWSVYEDVRLGPDCVTIIPVSVSARSQLSSQVSHPGVNVMVL